jgi:hypothetical protein
MNKKLVSIIYYLYANEENHHLGYLYSLCNGVLFFYIENCDYDEELEYELFDEDE